MQALIAALRELSLDDEAAVAERVAPLLHHAAPGAGSPLWRKAYYESAARNVTLLEALEEARCCLALVGVTPIAIKGADLATSLYPNVALRPMSDIDLLVGPEEVRRVENALAGLGYRPALPEMTEGLTRAVKHARLFVRARDQSSIDLHWSLVGHRDDRRAPDLDWFRGRARGGKLDPTAHLLYLSAHMKLQHYDESVPLLWLCDFYLLSRDPRIEWDAILSAAGSFGWEPALGATFDELRDRMGLEIPYSGKGSLPCRFAPIERREKGGAERAWNELSTLDWRGRARLLRAWALPSPSYLRSRYRLRPQWLWPLCYPWRWMRAAGGALRLLARGRRTRPLLGNAS